MIECSWFPSASRSVALIWRPKNVLVNGVVRVSSEAVADKSQLTLLDLKCELVTLDDFVNFLVADFV